jgi:hypothetical protein
MSNANQSANRTRVGDQPIMRLPTDAERDALMRRDRAVRYGKLAWKITKAGGIATAGLATMAAGTLVGQPHIGVPMLHHAAAEVIQIIEDPWD